MTSTVFKIDEHVLECQHIREYSQATAHSQEEVLQLAIKQYTPLDNLSPQPGDVTIIGAHANGFPKELYEPLWEDIHKLSKSAGFTIRGIWIADVSNQGSSGILNEQLIGNEPSWLDHSRDLLHMVNHFRAQMPMPIVGIGHSFGGAILVNLSLMHTRLFHSLILLDPVMQLSEHQPGPRIAQLSAFRRDVWPSRAEAEESCRKNVYYQSWDTRVLDRWLQHGLREKPSVVHPHGRGVTLSTTKHQECFTFLRPSWEALGEDGTTVIRPEIIVDMHPNATEKFPFYRPEPPSIRDRLQNLRPSVLYIMGETSSMALPAELKYKMEVTGAGQGGSGGAKAGRVKTKLLKGIGHLVAMEANGQCAEAATNWLGQELPRFEQEHRSYQQWTKKSLIEKSTLSEEWKKHIGGPPRPLPKSKI